eukprot:RCo038459
MLAGSRGLAAMVLAGQHGTMVLVGLPCSLCRAPRTGAMRMYSDSDSKKLKQGWIFEPPPKNRPSEGQYTRPRKPSLLLFLRETWADPVDPKLVMRAYEIVFFFMLVIGIVGCAEVLRKS